jgi:hypothetical protein
VDGAADLIDMGVTGALAAKESTTISARLMDGATEGLCSEFG